MHPRRRCEPATAPRQRASRVQLLRKPAIKEAVEDRRTALYERTQITQDWIIERLVANIEHAQDPDHWNGNVINRSCELLGRCLGMWNNKDNDRQSAPQDHVPLEERLKFYQME